MKQSVRIIGGRFRGKILRFPEVEGLRPTPNRVRETVFNWLMHDIRGARCLDAFAGSGALGFEAYSRGASQVTLLEQSSVAYANLLTTAATFATTDLAVLRVDARSFLQHCDETFDIVFLDPPFAKAYISECLALLANGNVLQPGGLIYLESPNLIDVDTTTWKLLKQKQSGEVCYSLYQCIRCTRGAPY